MTVNTSTSNNGDNPGSPPFSYLLGGTVKNVVVKGAVSVTKSVYMDNNASIVQADRTAVYSNSPKVKQITTK